MRRVGLICTFLAFVLGSAHARSALSLLFRRAKLADVVLVISLSRSNNAGDVDDAVALIHSFTSNPRLPWGRNGIRLAVVSNVIDYRTEVVMPLTRGTTRSAFTNLRIDSWKSTDKRQFPATEFYPITDVVAEDVFNGNRKPAGDRREVPNIIMLYVVDSNSSTQWLSVIGNKSNADIVVASTGRRQSDASSPTIDKMQIRKEGTLMKEWTSTPASDAMQKVAIRMAVGLHEALRSCLYKLEQKRCYFTSKLVSKSDGPPGYPCPCLFDVNVTVIRTKRDRRYCPNTALGIPCDYDSGPGCDNVQPRTGAGFPMWLFWILFVPLGVPLLLFMCFLPPFLIGPCMLPILIKELAETAVLLTLEKVLENIVGGEDVEQGDAEEEEWEDVEEDEEEVTEATEEQSGKERDKKDKKKKKKKETKETKKSRDKKKRKGKPRGSKMKKRKLKAGGKFKKGRKLSKIAGKGKLAKLGKMTPKTKKAISAAAKKFKGKGKVLRKGARPVGRFAANILLKVLKVVKLFRKVRGK